MPTIFVAPANPVNKLTTETSFVIEREIGKCASLLVEYVGDYNVHGGPSYLFNSGGGYRIPDTQQIESATTTRARLYLRRRLTLIAGGQYGAGDP